MRGADLIRGVIRGGGVSSVTISSPKATSSCASAVRPEGRWPVVSMRPGLPALRPKPRVREPALPPRLRSSPGVLGSRLGVL